MRSQVKKKVFVGMSGGVDSSVSAALLKRAGHDVTGVFIKVWQPDWMECDWRKERLDAMRAAAHIGIPFATLDLEAEYKKGVIDYMIAEYAAGRTPNPDVMCNREVKFGAFKHWAALQHADAVATGHYAQIKEGLLAAGADAGKDQSYFLWTLSEADLAHIMFPVGGMQKSEVRALARKLGLPNAAKKDSQGLCFIGQVDLKEFLSHYIEPRPGDVLDEAGRKIGHHDGAVFLTLGERHGFTVTAKTPHDAPYYVVAKDAAANTVTVSQKSPDGSLSAEKKEYELAQTNWVADLPQPSCPAYLARVRHLGELLPCRIESVWGSTARIVFAEPLIVAPGQSIVIYDGETCLGGGIVA